MKVFDSHVHVQPWHELRPEARRLLRDSRPDGPEVERLMNDPELFLRHLEREGIDRVCIINYVAPEVMGFTEEANRFSADFARRCGGRVIPYGSVHPLRTRDPKGDVRRLAEDGIRGLKIHPSHQLFPPNAYRAGLRALEEIYAAAQELGLVVMIHTGTSIFPGARNAHADPMGAEDIGVDFPELRVILAHGGRPIWMATAVFLVRRFPHFYLDVSGIPPRRVPEYFPELERISDKVLFGSDWPAPGVPGMRANVDAFLALPLSEQARARILFGNAGNLYG